MQSSLQSSVHHLYLPIITIKAFKIIHFPLHTALTVPLRYLDGHIFLFILFRSVFISVLISSLTQGYLGSSVQQASCSSVLLLTKMTSYCSWFCHLTLFKQQTIVERSLVRTYRSPGHSEQLVCMWEPLTESGLS